MRLVEGHDWEYPTPGQSVARKRVWGDFSTGGSRGIRMSHEYVRQGGAVAREMLLQAAAANEWKVPVSELTADNSVITHKASEPHHDLRQGGGCRRQARAGPKVDEAQGSEGLEDRRQAAEAARHPRQASPASRSTAPISSCPACSTPRSRNARCTAARSRASTPPRSRSMPGVKKVVQVGDVRRRGRGRHLVAGQDRARRAADRLGRRRERQGLERSIAEWLKAGLDAPEGLRRQPERRRQGRHRHAAKKVEAVYSYPYQNHVCMEPMNATALYTPEQVRGVGPDPERRSRVRRDRGGVRPAGRQVRGLQAAPRRRLRPARRLPRLRHAGGPDRQADARHAGQAVVVARGGHDAGPVSTRSCSASSSAASTRTTT